MDKVDSQWDAAKKALIDAASKAGVDVDVVVKIAGLESGYNSSARPISRDHHKNTIAQFDGVKAISSAYGLGQFTNDTWARAINKYGEKYGVKHAKILTKEQTNVPELRSDVSLQATMLAELTRDNMLKFARLGGADMAANIYAIHNLGEGDGKTFLDAIKKSPGERVDAILSASVIRGNPSLYGDGGVSVSDAYDAMCSILDKYKKYADEAVLVSRGNYQGHGERVTARLAERAVDHVANHQHVSSHTISGIHHRGSRGEAVIALQADLAALGYIDNRGQPLQPDGHFGRGTEAAVRAFQSDHGLLVDGIAGKNTLEALHGQRQLRNGISAFVPELEGSPYARFDDRINHAAAQREPCAGVLPEANPQVPNPFADPRHPDHGVYAELKERIPDASENRLAELTAACHMVGIKPGQLGDIHIGGQGIVVRPDGFGLHAVVDNSVPAPPIQQTVQQVKAFDFQQAQLSAQLTQAQAGPAMGGPGSYGR